MEITPEEIQQQYLQAAKDHFGAKNAIKWSAGMLVVGFIMTFASNITFILGLPLLVIALGWIVAGSANLSSSGKRLDNYEHLAQSQQIQLPVFNPASLTAPTAKSTRRHNGNLLAGLGALGLIIGSLLPWGQVSSILGTIQQSGSSGDGIIFMFLGIGIGLIALLYKGWINRSYSIWLSIVGIIAFFYSLMDLVSVSKAVSDSSDAYITASVGPGLYLVVASTILVIFAGFSKVPAS